MMQLYTNHIPNRQALCAGCGETIDQSHEYIQLELDKNYPDVGFGFGHAEFHTERCIAVMIKAAYAKKST